VLFALGTPKVIDFGIARAFEATSQHTGTDQMVGTVAYMAPERFDGDSSRIGPAADVFAWGVVVTYAGTGRTPFGGDSAAATAGAILTRPPTLDGLPAPLRELVARTLAKEPELRPTAFELLDELVAVGAPTTVNLTGRPELQRAAQAARRTSRRPAASGPGRGTPRRWRRLAPVLAVLAAVALGALALTPVRQLMTGNAAALPAPSTGAPRSGDVPANAGAGPAPSAPSPSRGADPAAAAAEEEDPTDEPLVAPTLTRTPAPERCRDGDLELSVTAQSDNPTEVGDQLGLVTIANRSDNACRVDGRVFVGLYNAADERVRLPTASVNEPGEAVDILLRPGTGAFQGIKWQACDRADSDCPTGNTLRGSLTSSKQGVVMDQEGFGDPGGSLITMKSLKLGTIQPSRQGVVAW
jgi:hypothetical protein